MSKLCKAISLLKENLMCIPIKMLFYSGALKLLIQVKNQVPDTDYTEQPSPSFPKL